MAEIKMRDMLMHTHGTLPEVGSKVPDFVLTAPDLSLMQLSDFSGRPLLINVYPSIDTQICFDSVKKFQEETAEKHVELLCVSMDLPFALSRIAEGEDLSVHISLLSDFRNRDFGEAYGLTIADGPLAGLLARSVLLLNEDHELVYQELVEDVTNPPDYSKVMNFLD